jgi:hypothetical protein
VFTTVFILGACSNGNHDQIKIRDIGIVGCNSIEDYQDFLYNQFDSIISNEDEGVIDLTLTNNLSNYQKKQFTFLSSIDESKKVNKKTNISFDCETLIFNCSISYECEGEVIKEDIIESNPYYVPETNDYYIFVDGEEISISEALNNDSIDFCIALVDDAVYLAAIAVVAVVIVSMPVIEKVVTGFVKAVETFFTSFWNWLKGIFSTKTTYTPVYEDRISYEVRYENITYTLVEADVKESDLKEKKYYLCVVATDEKKLYMSPIPLRDCYVAPILASSKYVNSFSKDGERYCLSTYTQKDDDAYSAALAAANLIGLDYVTFHSKYTSNGTIKSGLQFDHYHPGYDNGRCSHAHSLFGIPTLK